MKVQKYERHATPLNERIRYCLHERAFKVIRFIDV